MIFINLLAKPWEKRCVFKRFGKVRRRGQADHAWLCRTSSSGGDLLSPLWGNLVGSLVTFVGGGHLAD